LLSLFVKICLSRPAGRDKREIKNKISAKTAKAHAAAISNHTAAFGFSKIFMDSL